MWQVLTRILLMGRVGLGTELKINRFAQDVTLSDWAASARLMVSRSYCSSAELNSPWNLTCSSGRRSVGTKLISLRLWPYVVLAMSTDSS